MCHIPNSTATGRWPEIQATHARARTHKWHLVQIAYPLRRQGANCALFTRSNRCHQIGLTSRHTIVAPPRDFGPVARVVAKQPQAAVRAVRNVDARNAQSWPQECTCALIENGLSPRKPRKPLFSRRWRVGGVVTQRIANPCTGVRFSYSPPHSFECLTKPVSALRNRGNVTCLFARSAGTGTTPASRPAAHLSPD